MNYYRPTSLLGALGTMARSNRQIWREYRDAAHCRKKMRQIKRNLVEDLKPKKDRHKHDTRGAFALLPLLLAVLVLGFFFGDLADGASRLAARVAASWRH